MVPVLAVWTAPEVMSTVDSEHTAAGSDMVKLGNEFTVTVPLADVEEQVVLGLVITTL